MFVQRVNPLTGEAEWLAVNSPGSGGNEDASASLVASSSYLDMLTDNRRNRAYRLAIEHSIHARDIVLDIGTGTGLLAMMAARALLKAAPHDPNHAVVPIGETAEAQQRPAAAQQEVAGSSRYNCTHPLIGHVFGCEVFPPMAQLSKRIVSHNELANQVTIIPHRSDELTVGPVKLGGNVTTPPDAHSGTACSKASSTPKDPSAGSEGGQPPAAVTHVSARRRLRAAAAANECPSSTPPAGADVPPVIPRCADVIVTEIFDSQLLGEGLLPTLRHATQHLLKVGGTVIPATASVWAQPVESAFLWSLSQLPPSPATHTVAACTRTTAAAAAAMHNVVGASPAGTTSPATTCAAVAEAKAAAAASASTPASSPAASSGDVAPAASTKGAAVYKDVVPNILTVLAALDSHANAVHYNQGTAATTTTSSASFSALSDVTPMATAAAAEAAASVHDRAGAMPERLYDVHELHVDGLYPDCLRPLGNPVKVFEMDLAKPPPQNTTTVTQLAVSTSGTAHAIVLWWQLGMDARGTVLLATAPSWVTQTAHGADGGPLQGVPQRWRDHWKQCWAPLPQALAVARGDVLPLVFHNDDTSISVAAALSSAALGKATVTATAGRSHNATATAAAVVPQAPTPPLQLWLGPFCLCRLGDAARWQSYATAIERLSASSLRIASTFGTSTCEMTGRPPLWPAEGAAPCGSASPYTIPGPERSTWEVVAFGDGPMLPLIAAMSPGISAVTALQGHGARGGCGAATAWLAAAAAAACVPPAKLCCVQPESYLQRARAAAATAATAASTPMAAALPLLLLAEPYYRQQGPSPWDHLRFWHEFDVVRAAHPKRHTVCIPRAARLRAVAVTLPELWRSRRALRQVEGLNLRAANAVLGVVDAAPQCGAATSDRCAQEVRPGQLPMLAYAVWQAGGGYKEVSQRFDLLLLDCTRPMAAAEGNAVLSCSAGPAQATAPSWAAATRRVHHDQGAHVAPELQHQAAGSDGSAGGRGTGKGNQANEASCSVGSTTRHTTAERGAICHAIITWLDYDVAHGYTKPARTEVAGTASCSADIPTVCSLWVDNGPEPFGRPNSTVQGIYLLQQPVIFQTSDNSKDMACTCLHESDRQDMETNIQLLHDNGGVGHNGTGPGDGCCSVAPLPCSALHVAASFNADDGSMQMHVEVLP